MLLTAQDIHHLKKGMEPANDFSDKLIQIRREFGINPYSELMVAENLFSKMQRHMIQIDGHSAKDANACMMMFRHLVAAMLVSKGEGDICFNFYPHLLGMVIAHIGAGIPDGVEIRDCTPI